MKECVVFYSLSSKTKQVASVIAQKRSCDLFEIELMKPYTKVSAYLKGVIDTKKKAVLPVKSKIDLSGYDTIWIGTPIWAWTYAAPLNVIFKDQNLDGKKIIFYCTHEGSYGKAFEDVKTQLKKSTIIDMKDFRGSRIAKDKSEVEAWISSLKL